MFSGIRESGLKRGGENSQASGGYEEGGKRKGQNLQEDHFFFNWPDKSRVKTIGKMFKMRRDN